MTRNVDNSEDIIDSRDVIERIAELEADEDRDRVEDDELSSLTDFVEHAQEVSDWNYGEAFIRDSYFQTYAQELADDLGAIKDEISWPYTAIDWEQAARELQMDYTPYEFDGVTYWARA